jgi:hypothetical protein
MLDSSTTRQELRGHVVRAARRPGSSIFVDDAAGSVIPSSTSTVVTISPSSPHASSVATRASARGASRASRQLSPRRRGARAARPIGGRGELLDGLGVGRLASLKHPDLEERPVVADIPDDLTSDGCTTQWMCPGVPPACDHRVTYTCSGSRSRVTTAAVRSRRGPNSNASISLKSAT